MTFWDTWGKLFRTTLTAVALATFTTGCSLFTEEDEETDLFSAGEYYVSTERVAPGDRFHAQFDIGCWNEYSGDYHVAFYLSKDRDISWDDVGLGEVKMNGNWWLQTKRCSLVVDSLPNIPPGWYYVCAMIDSRDEEIEENEYNNEISFKYPIRVLEQPAEEVDEPLDVVACDAPQIVEEPAPQMVLSTDDSDTMGVVDEDVFLSAVGSHDPGGAPVTFRWTCLSSPAGFDFAASKVIECIFVPTAPGAYLFQVTMSNGKETISKMVSISVDDRLDQR